MTHAELVKIAEKWLLRTRKCAFAFTELSTINSETPDAIGFRDGQSILVECKVSRSDFLSDAKKLFRRNPEIGVGAYRFYLCPAGLIRPEDLPPRWGLVWVNEKGKTRQVVGPKGNAWGYSGRAFVFSERNIQAEMTMMASALRRLHLRGVLPMIYEQPTGVTWASV